MSISLFDQAVQASAAHDYSKAVEYYKESLDAGQNVEQSLNGLGECYKALQDAPALAKLVTDSRNITSSLAKAKAAKLLRSLIDVFDDIHTPDARQLQIQVLNEAIAWARSSARIFLAQSLETRLVAIYFSANNLKDALNLINTLLKELKRLDDKMILTEVHLLESKVHHALANLAKAKAALTSARTAANAIYCPPSLQAGLDMQSGVLHAEEKDYKTAFSYFFETLEATAAADDNKRAVLALKYMLLCKIMLNLSDDVATITSSKLASRYTSAGPEIPAMIAVADAHKNRSLAEFEKALQTHKESLSDDLIVRNHLANLYDTLLEQNLCRVIEPYSVVELDHIAATIGQPRAEVESKLSQMILDQIFYGILDQGAGCLVIYDQPEENKAYETTLDTLKVVSTVVDSLYEKATKLP